MIFRKQFSKIMDYFMNILYNDSNLFFGKIHRMLGYVFSKQLAGIRHGSYFEKTIHNTSGLENTPMEKKSYLSIRLFHLNSNYYMRT